MIHGNYLAPDEQHFLAAHAERMAVVYCPRTHAYFGHEAYPLSQLLAAGVPVALGTDSRASNPDLSLFEECGSSPAGTRSCARPGFWSWARWLGAGLGARRHVGTLAPGKLANLAVIALPECDAADPHELLFADEAAPVATYHRGRRVDSSVAPGSFGVL